MNLGPPIKNLIQSIRSQRVLLDSDLAELYGVPTKVLNQAVVRNLDRFPEDFMFRLSSEEWKEFKSLRSQIVTLDVPDGSPASSRGRHSKYAPRVFTEHGAIMAATLLNSPKAVSMSIYVVRAFVQMREQISANADVLKRLAEIDNTLLKHDKSLQIIWKQLQPLLDPPPATPKRPIGFHP
jgi:hypothetical protein